MKTIEQQKDDLLGEIILMLHIADNNCLSQSVEENQKAALWRYHNEPIFNKTAKHIWHLANNHAAKMLMQARENLTGKLLTDSQNLHRQIKKLAK